MRANFARLVFQPILFSVPDRRSAQITDYLIDVVF